MWLIDWIFGLLFGKGNSKNKTVVLSLEQLSQKIDETERKGTKDAEQKVFARIAEVKHLINEAEGLLAKIQKAQIDESEGNTMMRKVVASSKDVLIGKFSLMLEKLRPPSTMNFTQAWDYVYGARVTMAKEIVDMRKSIAYAGIMMKDEMKELGSTFEEMEKTLNEADSIMKKTRMEEISFLRKSIDSVRSGIDEADSINRKFNEAESEVQNIEVELKAGMEKAGQLRESPEMHAMDDELQKKSEASRRKQELKGKLIEKIGTVDKPLQRFSQLVESRKHLIDKNLEDILRLYMTNPFIAIKRDPKGTELRKILQEVKQLVEKGDINLKDDREKEKKLEALDNLIEYNFFDEIFWEMNKAEAELNRADKELSGMKVYSDISGHEDSARRRATELQEKQNFLNALAEKRRSHNEHLESLKAKAEELSSNFFGQNILLKL
jgi:hypothetical protein